MIFWLPAYFPHIFLWVTHYVQMLNGDRLTRPTAHAQTGIDLVHVTQSDTHSPLFVQMERIAASLFHSLKVSAYCSFSFCLQHISCFYKLLKKKNLVLFVWLLFYFLVLKFSTGILSSPDDVTSSQWSDLALVTPTFANHLHVKTGTQTVMCNISLTHRSCRGAGSKPPALTELVMADNSPALLTVK